MNPLTYYTEQSSMTDPGEYRWMFDDLPRDVAGLCRVVQGLVFHYREGEMFGYSVPEERLPEIDTRSVALMLARIRELDDRPLAESRPLEKRLIGCCRDFATLFCAMARHQGIPTRVRVGFGAYFHPTFNFDHEIAECWDVGEQRWKLVDPQMSPRHIQENHIAFDVQDVPRDQFLVGGLAWQLCRAGKADPERFGVAPDIPLRGMWFVRDKLVQDVAALNKRELLLWDAWGMTLKEVVNDEDVPLLDSLAVLTQAGDEALPELQALYEQHAGLRVSPPIMKYSPVAEPCEVTLEV